MMPCQFCGDETERSAIRPNVTCYNCKKIKQRERALNHKRKAVDPKIKKISCIGCGIEISRKLFRGKIFCDSCRRLHDNEMRNKNRKLSNPHQQKREVESMKQ